MERDHEIELDSFFPHEYWEIPDPNEEENGQGSINGDEQGSIEGDGSSPSREEEILDLDDIEV